MGARSALVILALVAAPATARQVDPPSAAAPGSLDGPVAVYPEHLAGRRMASGVVYRPSDFVAAHPTLPFGTELEVGAAGRTVRVTVMDRGPYDAEVRLLVSAAAGARLGLGDEPRWMRIRRDGAEPDPVHEAAGIAQDPGAWTVQIGSFADENAALRLAQRFSEARVEPGPGSTWRVVFGRFADRAEADAWRDRIAGWGVDGFVRPAGPPGS